jgi:hypothetical protein
MAIPNSVLRIAGTVESRLFQHAANCFFPVPLGAAIVAVRSSIYDVPGGYRAVMFDRFSGVQDKASRLPL